MKKIFLFLSIIILTITSCSKEQKKGFTITGTIEDTKYGSYDGYIFLNYNETKDSVKVVDNKYAFEGVLEKPVQGWINLSIPYYGSEFIFLENSNITISGKYATAEGGGETYNVYQVDEINGSDSDILIKGFQKWRKENYKKENYNAMYMDTMRSMIKKHPKSPVIGRLIADNAITSNKIFNYDQLLELYESLDTLYQTKSELKVIKEGLQALKFNRIGNNFKVFNLPDDKNGFVDSSILKGKKTMVDFWASWCLPCRKKHPKMIELYNKYKEKGFQIISISIDKKKEPWLNAIEKDKLVWENLLDNENALGSQLGITAIPFNYLLDEQGKIIAINKSLEEIESFIK